MATTYADVTGTIFHPDSPTAGIRALVEAHPNAAGEVLSLDEGLAWGAVTEETDEAGLIQNGGLHVPIVDGLTWTIEIYPIDDKKNLPQYTLGTFEITADGLIQTLVETDVIAITPTVYADIQAAAALGATNNTATASFVNTAGATQTALDARYSRKGSETILYAGDNGVVGNGTNPDWANMVSLLSTAGGMVGTHGAVVVDIKDLNIAISNTLTVPTGVTLRASSGGKFLLTQSRARMFDQTSTTGATFDGVTFDSRGLVTVQVVLVPATGVDTRFINKCKWINTAAVSVAVTQKALATNVVTLTVGAGHPFATNDVIYVHGVNGLTAADAGAFNTGSGSLAGGAAQSATISATTSTTISYPYYGSNTHADVTTVAASGWVTKGISGAGVYSVSCENAIRPYFEDPVFDGVRGGIRLYQACVSPRIIRPRFREWGDRCIFGVSTAGLLSTDVKILGAIIEAPSQKFGDPHQPIAFQGVATGEYHDGVEVAGCVSFGATSGGNLVPHHGRTTTDLFGGTADAFSFHHCRNLDVHDNVSKNSGEVGYTISNDCTQFMVHHNVSDGANSVGFAFDWGGSGTSFIGKGSSVHDNISLNAGQERGQAAVGLSPRTGASSAFWLSGVTDMLVHDNIARDTQGSPSQTSAYYIKDVTTGLSIGKTKLEGGTTLLLNASSSYTGTVDFYTAGTAASPQVDAYTTAGTPTWTKPVGAVRCDVIVISAGAGGGSGRRGAAASIRAGGGGGAGGMRVFGQFLASDLGATETVTVGTAGAGGTAVTVDSTSGVDGGAGGLSGFGATGVGRWLTAHGPNGGTGGLAGATTGGGAAAPGGSIGAAASATGAAGTTANNATGKGSSLTAGAGGSGGGLTAADAQSAGGAGGTGPTGTTTAPAGGTAGGGAGTVGTTTKAGSRLPGTGGAGGGSNLTGAGGAGGAGSAPGGGGGGGGASVNGNNSGAGGAGADGAVYVVTYFS